MFRQINIIGFAYIFVEVRSRQQPTESNYAGVQSANNKNIVPVNFFDTYTIYIVIPANNEDVGVTFESFDHSSQMN